MNRRELLTAGVAAVSATATQAINIGSEKLEPYREKLEPFQKKLEPYREPVEAKFQELEDRFDKLEHHHKNLIRVGGLAFAVSTGIDLAVFL